MVISKNQAISTVSAWKVRGGEIRPEPELLATESLLHLFINGVKAYQLLYLPGLEVELTVGFLLTCGIIEHTEDIVELRLTPRDADAGRHHAQVQVRLAKTFQNKVDVSFAAAEAVITGAPKAGQSLTADQFQKFPVTEIQVTVPEILSLMASLPERQAIFRQTGGTHAIFLVAVDSGEVVLGAEDVGRHNAFDKVIGQALMKNLPTGDKLVLLSGRASFEMVFKAARAGLPMMSSVSAPTSLAVQLADLQGITLIGFVRGERLNVYTHPHRLVSLGMK